MISLALLFNPKISLWHTRNMVGAKKPILRSSCSLLELEGGNCLILSPSAKDDGITTILCCLFGSMEGDRACVIER